MGGFGSWIWERLTSGFGSAAGGKPGQVGWDYAAAAADPARSPAPVAAAPMGGGQYGPTSAPPGNPFSGVAPGIDPAAWAAASAAWVSSNAPVQVRRNSRPF